MFDTTPILKCGRFDLKLDRPLIMGIVNLTPDSFSDGGKLADTEAAIAHALQQIEDGADLLDVGGESTRPGAVAVSAAEELDRVLPLIEGLAEKIAVPISIDTSKADVMKQAVAAGASMINDVRALQEEDALEVAAGLRVPICLMHMQGEPRTMQASPEYADVVSEVHRFLTDRLMACEFAGIDRKRLVVDPGFGFGKTLDHNIALLRNLSKFKTLERPILVGLSRKAMIGTLTGQAEPANRAVGSAAAAMLAVAQGAGIVRVHDVRATRDALAVWRACAINALPSRSADGASRLQKGWSIEDE